MTHVLLRGTTNVTPEITFAELGWLRNSKVEASHKRACTN